MELYNKYRPETFDELYGAELTIKSVRSELEHGTHVFMMTGPGGCGKTTIARIMAKEVGATELNVHEINSSSNTGIDTIREIEEQIKYAPLDGKASVYILDEFHRQSPQAQDACLKMLEECPEFVYFFICTTDPQKIIKPLKTRCSEINVKPLDNETMFRLLKSVAKQEGVKCNPDVYRKIAEISNGSSRDALKKLSSVLYLESDEERLEYLRGKGSEENPDVIELARALFKGSSWNVIAQCLEKCKDDIASNAESVRQLVMSYANSVLMKEYNANAVAMIQAFSQTDTYRNGKYAITVGCLDALGMME